MSHINETNFEVKFCTIYSYHVLLYCSSSNEYTAYKKQQKFIIAIYSLKRCNVSIVM